MHVKFILNNEKIPSEAEIYIICNILPLRIPPMSGISWEFARFERFEGYFEKKINFNSSGILQYKYIYRYNDNSVEEGFFNGQIGTREVSLKDGLVINDYWNKQTVPSKKRPCAFLWKSPIVAWDGNVTVCCADDEFLLSLGNLNDNSLKELWDGEKIKEFRLKHIHGKFPLRPKLYLGRK